MLNEPKLTFPVDAGSIGKRTYSQPRLFILLILGIFFAEIIAMIVIYYLQPEPYWVETVLDALIMTGLIFPLLYFFQFLPLITHVKERARSEALLSRVLENLPVGVWITDPQGNILHGNLASQKIWSGARYVGMDQYGAYKAWRLEDGKLVEPGDWAAARAIQYGEVFLDEELEIECFDGTHKIILNSAAPFYEGQTLQGVIIINQDISSRKLAEQALIKSEARLKTAFDVLPVGAMLTDESGNILYVNPAGQQIWAGAKYVGIEQFGEYKAWWVSTGLPVEPDDWAIARAVRNGETSLNEELEIECFDGSHKLILNTAIPVRDEQGQVHGVFVVNEDITQRKQAEQALLRGNELIGKAFNSIDILIAYMDRNFNFIKVNEAYAASDGRPAAFYEGKNHFELFPNLENQAIFQQVVDTGEIYSVKEKPFEYANNPERGVSYWNWRLQPVFEVDGSVQGLVLSLVDVTERKRAELKLQQQNQDLVGLSVAETRQRTLAEGLVESMLVLNASLELDEVLNTILVQISRVIDYQQANILLVDHDTLKIVHHHDHAGLLDASARDVGVYRLADYPCLAGMAHTQQPVLIEDTLLAPDVCAIPGLDRPCSFLAAPLLVSGRLTGVINLTSDQSGAFTPETARRLMAFSAPAALAVENARLYAAELQARQLAETLNEVSRALSQTLNFEKVMNTLLDYVCRLVPVDRAYIVICENESTLTIQALRGYEQENNPKYQLKASLDVQDQPYLQEVIDTQKSILIADTRDYPDWTTLISDQPMRNWLGIPIIVNERAMGVLVLAKADPDCIQREHIWLAEVVIAQAAVAIQNAWLFEQVRFGHERLQSLSRRLVEVQESERRYIARELHDEAGQSLTALKFGLRLLEQDADKPASFLLRISELKQLTDSVSEELHRLAMDLRPASLDYLGLVVALEQLVKGFADHYPMNMRFRESGFNETVRLADYVETNIYRIVQEALTNAVRHGQASNVDVIVENRAGKVVVMIEDDGVGFETSEIRKSGHLGLLGIQERTQMIAGSLQIESVPGGGTTIVVEVPNVHSDIDRG